MTDHDFPRPEEPKQQALTGDEIVSIMKLAKKLGVNKFAYKDVLEFELKQ